MKIVSTNIGERRVIDWKGELVTTGSFKFAADKQVTAGELVEQVWTRKQEYARKPKKYEITIMKTNSGRSIAPRQVHVQTRRMDKNQSP